MSNKPKNRQESNPEQEYLAFLKEHHPRPEDIDEYRKLKIDQIFTGQPTWVIRNHEASWGVIYDLYTRRNHFGFIDLENGIADIYVNPLLGTEGPVKDSTIETGTTAENLIEAIKRLEELVPKEN